MNFQSSKVLISHHWLFEQQRYPIFSHDEFYITSSKYQHPNVINLPLGASFDVSELLKKLPPNWYPDLFIAKVDSFFNIVPRNVACLKCPKVLILGDTQHGVDPLNRMIAYAKSENYDFYITDHKRHHLWYYWLAGLTNLYWLPGLFLNPPDPGFEQQPWQSSNLNKTVFNQKIVFIGQAGRHHPRRQRIIKYAQKYIPGFIYGQLPQKDSFKAFTEANISLNISLNGDLNLRIFEILAAGSFLLTDQLTDESGIDLLLKAGEEYEEFATIEELQEKIVYFSQYTNFTAKVRQRGHERYCREYTPQKIATLLTQLLQEQPIEDRFTIKSINRIQYCQDTEFSRARISLYQVIQDFHREWENVEILLDARINLASVADFLDLPRVQVTLTNYDDAYIAALKPYLEQSGNYSRVRFARDAQFSQGFNVIITSSCSADLLEQVHQSLGDNFVAIISNDYRGLDIASKSGSFQDIISNQNNFDNIFYVIFLKNSHLNELDVVNSMESNNSININNPINSNFLGKLDKRNNNSGIFPQEEKPVVCVVHPNKNAYSETFIRAHIENLPARVIDLPGVWFPLHQDKSVLKQFLLENNVDVVLAEFAPAGVAVMEICHEIGLPLVVHFHGFDAHHTILLQQIGEYYSKLFAIAASIIASSQNMRSRLLELGSLPEKIVVNPYGVDTSLFVSANPNLSPPTFLAVGRFVDKKAPYLTLLAFRKVLDKHPAARLVMVGDGVLLEACKQITKSLKMADAVQFLGVLSPDEIATLMQRVRAFVQHSVCTSYGDSESLGVVFLEAGASGLPVVATRHDGIPEVVLDGKTGWIVEEGDVDGMAECMLKLAEDSTLAAQLGKAGRERICTEFTKEKSINGLWEIIKAAIQDYREKSLIKNLNLSEINLIVFPDWSQPEERLDRQIKNLVGFLVNNPNEISTTLLIDARDISKDDANLILTSAVMELVLEEGVNMNDEPAITLLTELSQADWDIVLAHCSGRIAIEGENRQNISKTRAETLPVVELKGN